MIAALILMMILSFLCAAEAGIATYVAWKSVMAFMASEAQKEEYQRYIKVMISEIQDGSQLFRLELVRRMSADIPEVRDLNKMLQALEISMVSFRKTLEQFLLDEE